MSGAAYAFGPFTLDPGDRRLLRNGEPVEVTARYFDALLLLVSEGGRLVSKERFHDEVWNGIPVTDEALTQCVRTLRRALGDDAAAPQFIETVPRHGYRFVARVETAAPVASALPPRAAGMLPDVVAASLGGGLAGIVGALGYLSLGFVNPAIGAASTLLVFVSVNLLLGLLGGAFVGGGIALAPRAGAWPIASGAIGGLLVGAIGHMVGNDVLQMFFGRIPAAATGAYEGLLLGAATGTGVWLAQFLAARTAPVRILPGFALGAFVGAVFTFTGGRLMIGSLAAMADQFPESRLQFQSLGSTTIVFATVAEAALFVGTVTAALLFRQRLRR